MSLFSSAIGNTSLQTYKKSIDITNQNMANVFTEGYSRKTPIFSDLVTGGVELSHVERSFDQNLHTRYIAVNQRKASDEEYKGMLDQVETLYNDLQGSGLSSSLDAFFNAFNDVAVNPANMAARQEVLSAAQALTGRIRSTHSDLEQIKSNTVLTFRDTVAQINELTSKLGELNLNIGSGVTEATAKAAYLDERDRTLQSLSALIDTSVTYNADGTVNVATAKGFDMVLRDKANTMSFSTDVQGDPHVTLGNIDITPDLQNGILGGQLRGVSYLNKSLDDLNDFATAFTTVVNKQHTQGFDASGAAGLDFFAKDPGSTLTKIDASNITLNLDDPALVAASADSAYPESDNTNVKKLLDLKTGISGVLTPAEETALSATLNDFDGTASANFDFMKTHSFNEFYNSKVAASIGFEVQHVGTSLQTNAFLQESIDAQIQAKSGVNMDEELSNLVKLQRAYEASARIITVSDELLQTTLNMIR